VPQMQKTNDAQIMTNHTSSAAAGPPPVEVGEPMIYGDLQCEDLNGVRPHPPGASHESRAGFHRSNRRQQSIKTSLSPFSLLRHVQMKS
jgi:hypothetical protein